MAKNVSDTLDGLRAGVPGCTLVAYIDLEAELVLSASAPRRPAQERLDALAALAKRLLPISDGPLAAALNAAHPPDEAVLLDGEATHVLVRSDVERSEAMCCSCTPHADIEEAIAETRAALQGMAAPG